MTKISLACGWAGNDINTGEHMHFEHFNFEIVSSFVLRISDFLTNANKFMVFYHVFVW
jgi:hypothetical protein